MEIDGLLRADRHAAAIELAEAGVDVLALGKRPKSDAHTSLAAGGINAALSTMDPDDSWQQHAADTLKESYLLADPRTVEIVTKNAARGIQDLERYGMPLVLWSYPRGSAVNAKGGTNTLYAQDYAARIALELGADIVKLHEPNDSVANVPAPYDQLQEDAGARCARVVRSAGRTMVLFSGGVKDDDDAAVLRQVEFYMQSGANGVMFGRNMWLRPFEQALALVRSVHGIMAKYPR